MLTNAQKTKLTENGFAASNFYLHEYEIGKYLIGIADMNNCFTVRDFGIINCLKEVRKFICFDEAFKFALELKHQFTNQNYNQL